MKIDGLDIPLGLEQLFYNIFRPLDFTIDTTLATNKPRASYRQKSVLNAQSLFVRWQGLYNGFDSSRKMLWTAYWETLPFGLHTGGNGWPGSGFSAFVYVNAPRFKASEDLLLDPPSSFPELIVNGDFNGNATGWTLEGFLYFDHNVGVTSDISDADFFQSVTILSGAGDPHARLQFDLNIVSGALHLLFLNGSSAFVYTADYTSSDNGHIDIDIDLVNIDNDFIVYFYNDAFSEGYITNVSLKSLN